MFLVNGITESYNQTQSLILTDGTTLSITMYYSPIQRGWFFTDITYQPKQFTISGLRICNNPNMLNQWRNEIPFGIACFSMANREPYLLQDFESGNSKLYVLTSAETTQWANYVAGTGTLT